MTLTANWSYPTSIRFGDGRLREIGETTIAAGIHRPLLVTDRQLRRLPFLRQTADLLAAAGASVAVFDNVDANPNEANLASGIAAFNNGGHDGVVAIGGGSSLDLGKLIALMARQTRPVWDFEDIGDYWRRADADAIYPVVAVPTTAGTGSEVGRAGVLSDSEKRVKKIIFHPKLLPVAVICDPRLTVGLPPALTAGVGMDALTHCIEAHCSPFYHPMSQGVALEGMRLIMENLPRAFADGENIDARAHMMSAAMMGAVAFQKGLGAAHALSHPVGAMYGAHHGMTNAIVLPAVLRFNRAAIESRLAAAAAYLGIGGGFDGFHDAVMSLRRRLGVPETLAELGVEMSRVDELAAQAIQDPSVNGNPLPLTEKSLKALFKECITGHL